MSTASLAVFTSQMGASFINLHMRDLAPGRTVAIARSHEIPPGGFWEPSCPTFCVDQWAMGYGIRIARRLKLNEQKLREAAIARFFHRHRVSVVLGEFLDEFVEFVPLLDRLGIPYVAQSHGNDASAALRRPGIAAQYLAYRSARAVLTRCAPQRQRLIDLGLPANKVHVNHGGVPVPSALPVRDRDARKRLLAISYMVPKKGSIFLLEAFRLAARRDPELSLDYVGGGPLFPGVRQFVNACNLAGQVRLHGVASEEVKHRLLMDCGVFVQHSVTDADTGDEEGLPSSIQEAMGYGLAVVSTRHSGIPEAVEHGVTGLLVEERDVDAMADAMIGIGKNAFEMGREGHRRALAEHTWECEKSRLMQWIGMPA